MNNVDPIKTSNALTTAGIIILGLVLAIFSLNLAVTSTVLASLSMMIFIYGAYSLAKSKKLLAVLLVVLGGAMFVAPLEMLDGAISSASVFFCLIGGMAIGGVLLGKKAKGIIFAALFSAVSYVAACVFTGSPLEALSALLPLPGAIVLAVCSKKKVSRITSLCLLTAVFLAVSYLPDVILLIAEHKAEAFEYFKGVISEVKTVITDTLNESFASVSGGDEPIYSPETVKYTVEFFFNIFPALVIVFVNAISFVTQSCFFALKDSVGEAVRHDERILTVSKVSAWMFFISLLTMIITAFIDGQASAVISVSMMNLNIILLPIFALINVLSFIAAAKLKRVKPSVFTVILIIFLVINFGALLLYPLAAMGAIAVIKAPDPVASKKGINANNK